MFEGFKHHTYPGEKKKNRNERRLATSSDDTKEKRTAHGSRDENVDTESLEEKYREAQKMISEVISHINERVLYETFAEELGKSGGDIATMNFIPLEKIEHRYENINIAEYGVSNNLIGIDIITNAKVLEKKEVKPSDAQRRLEILHSVIHEETHAVAHTTFLEQTGINHDDEVILHAVVRAGYRKSEQRLTKTPTGIVSERTDVHRAINEGVTELLAQRILKTYNQRSPLIDTTHAERDVFIQQLKKITGSSYSKEVYAAKLYATLLSEATGVPYENVENALVRGYLRGAEFISDEAVTLLDELLGDSMGKFLKTMSENNTSTNPFEDALSQADIKIPPAKALKLLEELV